MPIYEYICEKCGEQLELFFRSIPYPSEVICHCKGLCKRKEVNSINPIYNCDGFYKVDKRKGKI